jgi:hypothetical protein
LLTGRYGIKATYSVSFAAAFFQQAIEKLDKYTESFIIPVIEYESRAVATRKPKNVDVKTYDPEFEALDRLYHDNTEDEDEDIVEDNNESLSHGSQHNLEGE